MCTRFKVEQLSWGVKSCSKKQQQINSGSCRERGEGWESACEWGRHWGGRIHSPQRLSVSQDFPSRTLLLLLLLWVCSLRGHTLPYLDLDLAKQWRVDCDAKFKLNCGRSIYAWMVDVGITSYCKSTRAEKSDCLNDFKHQVSPISFGVDCCFIRIFFILSKVQFFPSWLDGPFKVDTAEVRESDSSQLADKTRSVFCFQSWGFRDCSCGFEIVMEWFIYDL